MQVSFLGVCVIAAAVVAPDNLAEAHSSGCIGAGV